MSRPHAVDLLSQSPQPLFRRLKVEENDKEIVIFGTLPSYYLKQLAQEAVRPVSDGRTISNQIRVSEPL
jgi:hypothetical protein